ncbi:hypothetical protein ACW73L_04300 [Methylolobus aquaticus]
MCAIIAVRRQLAMRRLALVFLGATTLMGCADGLGVSPWLAGDWKCGARDSNGNVFFGIAASQEAALEKARWQCVSGSPYKQTCAADRSYCEQLR